MKNSLIVFEGIDGVGKSSTARVLQQNLLIRGIGAICYEDWENKSDGFNSIKSFIKKDVSLESSLFFYIASSIHKSTLIKELLKKQWVICDRYVYSTVAYHLARGIKNDVIPDISKLPILIPDYYFLLKTEESIRIKRLQSRSSTTSDDLEPKTVGSFFDLMERSFELYNPKIINNSNVDIDVMVNQILKIIGV
jgi:dTMP kinase